MIDPRDTGMRIRRLREAAELRQKDLAQRASISSGAISMIETGAQFPDAATLAALAEVLDCTPDYLTRERGPFASSKPWLRAYADASKRTVDAYVSDTMTAAEAILELNLKRLPDRLPTFTGDPDDDDAIETFADAVREIAQVPDGAPVGNATRAAERLGVVVLPMRSELGRHLGMSMRVSSIPMMRVSRPSEDPDHPVPGDRQRFTVCHELGHLLLHADLDPPGSSGHASAIEDQANRFASAFLVPAEPLLADFKELGGRPTLTTFVALKGKWGFSVKAFVKRFSQLGIIEQEQARSLYKQISARRWNKYEPEPVGNEAAQWLTRRLKDRASINPDMFSVAAAGAGIGPSFFARWTEWAPVPHADADGLLLDFPESDQAPVTVDGEPASVRRLPVH